MSKYIKQDDVFELVRKGVLISNGNFESVCKAVGSLPTIEVMEYPQVEGITPTLVTTEVSEDCISREWLLKYITKGVGALADNTETFADVIRNAPSVVPTTEQSSMVGEWIVKQNGFAECSVCEQHYFSDYNYCPNCGAKMKGN